MIKEPNHYRIIIIDPQNDFTSKDGLYAKKHKGISQIAEAKARINQLFSEVSKQAFIIIRSDYRKDQFEKGLTICAPGTYGNELDKDLHLDSTFTLFTKTEHSSFTSKSFNDHLKNTETRDLYLCGFLAEYCVKQTALDAIAAGYKVHLIEDCIGTGDDVQFRKEEMLRELESKGAVITNSIKLMEKIKN